MKKSKALLPTPDSDSGRSSFIPDSRDRKAINGTQPFIQPTVQQNLQKSTQDDSLEKEAEQAATSLAGGESVGKSGISTSAPTGIQRTPLEDQNDFSVEEGERIATDNEEYVHLSEFIDAPGRQAFSDYEELLAFASMKAQNVGLSEGRDYWYSQGTHGVAVFKLNEGEGFSDEGKIFVSPEGRFLLAHIYRRSLAGNGSGQALRASGSFGDPHDIGRIFSHRNSNLVALLSVDGRIYHMSSYDRSIVDPEATDVDGYYDMVDDYRSGDLELTDQEGRLLYNALIKSQALDMLSEAYISLEETEGLLVEQPAEEMADYLRTMKDQEVEFDIWISLLEEVENDMDSQVSIFENAGVAEVMVLNIIDGTRTPAHYYTAKSQLKQAKSGIESQRAAYRSGMIDKNPLSRMLGPMLYHVDPDEFTDDGALQAEMVAKVAELKVKVKTFEKEVVKGSVDPQDLSSAVAEVHSQLDIKSTMEFAMSSDQMDEFSQRAEEARNRHGEAGMAYSLGMTALGATVGAFNPVLGALIFMGELGGSAMELKSAYDLYQLSEGYYDKASAVVDPDAAWTQFMVQSALFALELALEAFPIGLDMYNTYKVNQWSNIADAADVVGAVDVPTAAVTPPVTTPSSAVPETTFPRTRGDELAETLGYPELPSRTDYMWVKGPKDVPYVRRRNSNAPQRYYDPETRTFPTGSPRRSSSRSGSGSVSGHHQPDIVRPENQRKYRALSEKTSGTGGIQTITGYKNADGGVVVKIEGWIRNGIKRLGFERMGARGVGEIGLDGYENAHLWGPGFGDEARAGIMYAPRELNQAFQRLGIELRIRDLRDLGYDVHLSATAEAYDKTTLGDLGYRLYRGEEVLKSVKYEVGVLDPRTGEVRRLFDVEIHVDLPPSGRVTTEPILELSGYRELDSIPTSR